MHRWIALIVLATAWSGCLDGDAPDPDCCEADVQDAPAPPVPAPVVRNESVSSLPYVSEWWMPCDRATSAPSPARDGWMDRRVLHIAHQGGENEVPSATMYALKTSIRKGADMLEIDVHVTADGELVVLHDTSVDRTTDGSGAVQDLSLAQIKALDAAYWFVPGIHAPVDHDANGTAYVLRGVRTGDVAPPPGCTAEDFAIPTLREVLQEFPDVMMNIEIKNGVPQGTPYEEGLAALLAEFGRGDDTIVASFIDTWTETFRLYNMDVDTSTGTGETAIFKATSLGLGPGSPTLLHDAFQVPITFSTQGSPAIEVVTEDFVADAHANGMAVHVWTVNDPGEMHWLIDIGVDGIMTAEPEVLERVLQERGVAWT